MLDYEGTLELALRLHPRTREVVVIHDQTETGLAARSELDASLPRFENRVSFRFLTGIGMAETCREIGQLPTDRIILITSFVTDGEGHTFNQRVSTEIIRQHCSVPIYGVHEARLGFGIIGGKLLEGRPHGAQAAEIVLRVLGGEDASSIPVVQESATRYLFDYAQLTRFGIALSALPPGSVVINQPRSFYHRYKSLVWGTLVLFAAMICAIAVLTTNILRRRRAEELLRESLQFKREIIACAGEGIVVYDREFHCMIWNSFMERLTGLSSGEMTGKRVDGLFPQRMEHSIEGLLQLALLGETVCSPDLPLALPDAETVRWTAWTFSPRRDANDATVGVIAVVRDLTERKKEEEERRAFEAQMQHAQKLESLGVLAGGIAHDFNNLLVAILGNAELALMELSPVSPVREPIQDIIQASRRAADLAKQMLAYSGKGRFVVTALDLSEMVREMSYLLEVSISKRATLKTHLATHLPCIEGDATQIRQVIMNLITNASEAIGDMDGIISLTTGVLDCTRASFAEAYLAKDLAEGLYVYLDVTDSGCGMDSATLAKVFDPFFTTKFTGRGLGLAAVHGIIRGHKGAIKIRTEKGHGASLQVLFPALAHATAAAQGADAPPMISWRGQGTVLLVDDEETVRDVGTKMLRKMGFDVLPAKDGREAVELFRQHAGQLACVVLDLTMPHMDGEQTCQELIQIDPSVPVILASGYNEQELAQRFTGTGFAGFLQKPYQYADLLAKLRDSSRAR